MATYPYRQPTPGSLEDLIAQQANAPEPAVPPQEIPQAPSVDTQGILTPQDRQRLIDVLFQPNTPGPAPTVDKPSALAMLFSGLGDAVSAFAAGKSGNPAFSTDYFGDYQRRLAKQKADLQEFQRRSAAIESASRSSKAEFLLSQSDKARMRADELQGRKELQTAMLAQRADAAAQAAADRAAQRDLAIQLQKMKDTSDLAQERARGQFQESVAKISANQDKTAVREDKKDLGQAMQYVSTLAEMAPQILKDGTSTPDQIQTRARRYFDSLVMSPESRKAADAYFQSEIVPTLTEYMNQQLAASSPQQSPPVPAPNAFQRAGNVLLNRAP